MNPDFLINGVLSSVLGGGRKRSRRALRYLTGCRGSFWTHPSTLLTAAGVAWGMFETLQQGRAAERRRGPVLRRRQARQPAREWPRCRRFRRQRSDDRMSTRGTAARAARDLGGQRRRRDERPGARRGPASGDVCRRRRHRRARAQSADGRSPRSSPASAIRPQSATLYVLAFTILRADEQVHRSGAYLSGAARRTCCISIRRRCEQLEKDTGERIDAVGDQGQPGG